MIVLRNQPGISKGPKRESGHGVGDGKVGMIVGGVDEAVGVMLGVNVGRGVGVMLGVNVGRGVRVGPGVSVGIGVREGVAVGGNTAVAVSSASEGYNSSIAEYQSRPPVIANSVKRAPG